MKRFEALINHFLSKEEHGGHLRIPVEDIKLATNNFSPENVITLNSSETVYKGEISLGEKRLTVRVNVQRLVDHSQMHLPLISILLGTRFENPNIMSLLGFCIEDDKVIFVSEHSAYGSLHNYFGNTILTWKIRLNICIGAARGLIFLHDNSLIIFGLTSSNIFLDTNWEAKVSHFESFIETDAVYSNPAYKESDLFRTRSNIYSFGIVLFEVLCGRLAFDTEYESDSHSLMKLVEQCYKEGKLDDIIDPFLKNQMAPDSLRTFSNIAYQCCHKFAWHRPRIDRILQKLEQAVALQLEFERLALLHMVWQMKIG